MKNCVDKYDLATFSCKVLVRLILADNTVCMMNRRGARNSRMIP